MAADSRWPFAWGVSLRPAGAPERTVWTASTVSAPGDGVTAVAAPLLVASRTGNPLLVSGAVFAAAERAAAGIVAG